MNKLTDDEIRSIGRQQDPTVILHHNVLAFARAIESAATELLLQRIADLEQRNSDLHEDVQRFKEHALNEKVARMELERQLHEQAVSLEEAREKLVFARGWIAEKPSDRPFSHGKVVSILDRAIEAAMQKGKS